MRGGILRCWATRARIRNVDREHCLSTPDPRQRQGQRNAPKGFCKGPEPAHALPDAEDQRGKGICESGLCGNEGSDLWGTLIPPKCPRCSAGKRSPRAPAGGNGHRQTKRWTVEDQIFKRMTYINSMADFLTARGISPSRGNVHGRYFGAGADAHAIQDAEAGDLSGHFRAGRRGLRASKTKTRRPGWRSAACSRSSARRSILQSAASSFLRQG